MEKTAGTRAQQPLLVLRQPLLQRRRLVFDVLRDQLNQSGGGGCDYGGAVRGDFPGSLPHHELAAELAARGFPWLGPGRQSRGYAVGGRGFGARGSARRGKRSTVGRQRS